MEMGNQKPEVISYYDHEAQIARSEANAKRWACAALIIFVALVISNLCWIIYESQFQDVYTATQTVTQDTGEGNGTNTYNGDFYGGGNGKTNRNANDN